MTTAEEEYVHYTGCCDSLNSTWRILQELLPVEKKAVIYDAAFRFALIEYAKPYKRSDGAHRKGRNGYVLPTPKLPADELVLHKQILDLRDKLLAHSDLTLKGAMVSLARFDGRASICIAQNGPLPLPDLNTVIHLVEATLTLMYVEKARMLEALAPNF